jgi:hypothetical protein
MAWETSLGPGMQILRYHYMSYVYIIDVSYSSWINYKHVCSP